MEKVTLTGRTKKGKNRVRYFGPTWCVIRREDRVAFYRGAGPWLFVAPLGRDAQDYAARWVLACVVFYAVTTAATSYVLWAHSFEILSWLLSVRDFIEAMTWTSHFISY